MSDDRDLLQRLVSGDEAAYDAVFRAWYAPLVRFVNAMLRQLDEAEEIAQEVMLELWQHRMQLDPERPVQAWLFRAARNRALNVIRHAQVKSASAPALAALSSVPTLSDERVQASELQAAMHEALAELPPRCREVFLLSRAHGMRNAQIAEQLGVSVKAVEGQMARALRGFRERLSPYLPPGRIL